MYTPNPINTDNIVLSEELLALTEMLASNVHENWAAARVAASWTYGPVRDDAKKETPCLVPYDKLTEEEKEYDRRTALESLKTIIALGYRIEKDDTAKESATVSAEENGKLLERLSQKVNEIFGEPDTVEPDKNDDDDSNLDIADLDTLENTITLTDEEGKEVPFEFLDIIKYEGNEYVILLPQEPDDGDGEVVILMIEDSDSDDVESYVSVDDAETLNAVFEIFKEKFKDTFNFTD